MAYVLGNVKPWVKTAANHFGPKYGIKTVYGVGPGSVKNSDHPKGLALDFMINNIPNGRATGDAMAAEALANMAAFDITYVIWYKRINTGSGWRSYSGPSDHTDHVHMSFGTKGGTGQIVAVGNPTGTIPAVFGGVDDKLKWITDAHNWARIGWFICGFSLAMYAIIKWNPAVKTIAKGVAKGAKR